MTNKQYLVAEIKKLLERDDLTDHQRVRLLSLRQAPAPSQTESCEVSARKGQAQPVPAPGYGTSSST